MKNSTEAHFCQRLVKHAQQHGAISKFPKQIAQWDLLWEFTLFLPLQCNFTPDFPCPYFFQPTFLGLPGLTPAVLPIATPPRFPLWDLFWDFSIFILNELPKVNSTGEDRFGIYFGEPIQLQNP